MVLKSQYQSNLILEEAKYLNKIALQLFKKRISRLIVFKGIPIQRICKRTMIISLKVKEPNQMNYRSNNQKISNR